MKHPANYIEMVGLKFGRLTVISRSGSKDGRSTWNCKCECSEEIVASGKLLRIGHVQSCGCLASDMLMKRNFKHGLATRAAKHPLKSVWQSMKDRCLNPNNIYFKHYGGRGISVCDRWLHSLENFINDMGERPTGYTIERKNTNGNYSPENCVWASQKDQQNNRSNNVFMTLNGVELTATQWGEKLGLKPRTILMRMKRGWSDYSALTTPVDLSKSHG